jgi:hypothetical protein
MSKQDKQEIHIPGIGYITFPYKLSEQQLHDIREQLAEKRPDEMRVMLSSEPGVEVHPLPDSLQLDEEQRTTLKKFWEDGLIWLVNTAVLHPRGYALAIHVDTENPEALPLGLSIVGDGSEPWVFETDKQGELLVRYETAEARREAAWSEAIRTAGGGDDAAERVAVGERIVDEILDDLRDRKGIGNELDQIDEETLAEMRETLSWKVSTALRGERQEPQEG